MFDTTITTWYLRMPLFSPLQIRNKNSTCITGLSQYHTTIEYFFVRIILLNSFKIRSGYVLIIIKCKWQKHKGSAYCPHSLNLTFHNKLFFNLALYWHTMRAQHVPHLSVCRLLAKTKGNNTWKCLVLCLECCVSKYKLPSSHHLSGQYSAKYSSPINYLLIHLGLNI